MPPLILKLRRKMKIKFLKNAPCGFDGYGATEEITDHQFKVFSNTGMYKIEVLEEAPKQKAKKKKSKGKK